MSAGLRGHYVQKAHHRRGYARVAVVVGGDQSRGEARWSRHTRRNGTFGTEGTNVTRDGQLTRNHRLFQRLQRCENDDDACGGGASVPAPTPLVTKCYGTRPADVCFRMDSTGALQR